MGFLKLGVSGRIKKYIEFNFFNFNEKKGQNKNGKGGAHGSTLLINIFGKDGLGVSG